MEYRRFGKTEKALSVITLGGMRYIDGWSKPRETPTRAMIDQAVDMLRRAFAAGINHVETAYGYSRSEYCYGQALEEVGVRRSDYFLMTKGDPDSPEAAHRMLEEQLKGLRTDRIDLYAWHGLNNPERFRMAMESGALDVLSEYQAQGVIGNLGFSSHATPDVIARAIVSGRFDFVNLHYYYFFQRNFGALLLAAERDMGVFIISPNDKGGQLWNASEKVKKLVAPATPIQWNARFCLRLPFVHTLSFGMTQPSHVEEMLGVFPTSVPLSRQDLDALVRMDAQIAMDPISAYEGFEFLDDPSGINIPEVLRFRKMLKCYDMEAFGKYRYNMFEDKGHWFPGAFATPDRVEKVRAEKALPGIDIRALLNETHQALYVPKEK
jgi:predicted aldo/keto reductase-like oxidoreductase